MLGKPKNRYQAFAVHIGISAIIFIVLAAIIIFIWYPGFLFHYDGGWQGIRLIAGVDFIIGPTLTLIVYKAGKRGLKSDLILIALVQFFCLAAGCWIVYQERPMTIFHVYDSFYTVPKKFFDKQDIDPELALSLDNKVPAWVYIELPENKDKRLALMLSQLAAGPLYAQPDRYRPFKENLDKVLEKAADPSKLDETITSNMSKDSVIIRYVARYKEGYIELDKNTGAYIKFH